MTVGTYTVVSRGGVVEKNVKSLLQGPEKVHKTLIHQNFLHQNDHLGDLSMKNSWMTNGPC